MANSSYIVIDAQSGETKEVRLIGNGDDTYSILTVDVAGLIDDGRTVVATPGTAVPLAKTTPSRSVVITAETDNTGVIVVGCENFIAALGSRRGILLSADDTISIDIDDLSKIYLDATVGGERVTFVFTA